MPTVIPPYSVNPSRKRPATYADERDTYLSEETIRIAAKNAQSAELNALAIQVDEQSQQVADAAAIVGATKWVTGENVAEGLLRWSPSDGMVYRHRESGVTVIDPADDADPATGHWWMIASIKKSGNYEVTLTATAATNVTLPTAGTLATTTDFPASTQAQMEAGTDNTASRVTPLAVNWHPGVAKAWLKCGKTGNVLASHNITSITDTGTGVVTITLATDFSSIDYAIIAIANGTTALAIRALSQAAGTFQLYCFITTTGALADPENFYYVTCFGDQ